MNIELITTDTLKPAHYNPRTITEAQINALRRSIAEFGMVEPIVVNSDNTIIGGHQRFYAAKELGLKEVPCVRVDLAEDAEKQLNLALNRISGDWDEAKLSALLDELRLNDADLSLTGFEQQELEKYLSAGEGTGAGLTDENEVPSCVEVVTQPGDVWLLGKHRLMCGDATKEQDVKRLMHGAEPSLMVTDPPYGVDYDPEWRNEAAEKGQIAHAARRVGKVANDDIVDWFAAWKLSPAKTAYVWHAGYKTSETQKSLESAGYQIRCQIIWAKQHFAISRGHYHWMHEPCWYAVKKGGTADWIGDRSQTTLWEIGLDKNVEGGHSTQKPVECMARAIKNHSGDVYDPFCGSGTTLIACENLKRKCFAMEIEPKYCDVIIKRWELYTGQKSTKEESC